jgi:hypothetical protein
MPQAEERMRRQVETAVAGIGARNARVRLGAAKALRVLSERAPEEVYPHFDFLVGLLEHDNSILRWNAMLALGNLAAVDGEGRLERMLDAYLAPIAGPRMIDAASTIRGAASIAAAQPHRNAATWPSATLSRRSGDFSPPFRTGAWRCSLCGGSFATPGQRRAPRHGSSWRAASPERGPDSVPSIREPP